MSLKEGKSGGSDTAQPSSLRQTGLHLPADPEHTLQGSKLPHRPLPGPFPALRDCPCPRVQGFEPPCPHSHQVDVRGPNWARGAERRQGHPNPCGPGRVPRKAELLAPYCLGLKEEADVCAADAMPGTPTAACLGCLAEVLRGAQGNGVVGAHRHTPRGPPTAPSLKGSLAVPWSLCRDHGTTAQRNKKGGGETPRGPVTWGKRCTGTCPPNTHSTRPDGRGKAHGRVPRRLAHGTDPKDLGLFLIHERGNHSVRCGGPRVETRP